MRDIRKSWFPFVVVAFTFWVARYWHWQQFGLYEDDLTIIPTAWTMTQGELFRFLFDYITRLSGHARPISDSLIYLFSNWGWKLGGFTGPYWIGWAIETLNLGLFYALLRRCAPPGIAILSTFCYALFSADTTQAYLTHSLGLHPSLTLLLLAAHAYLSGRYWLAYPLAGLILFAYESPFLVFLGVPLLRKDWNRGLLKEWLRHTAVLLLMLLGVFLLRRWIGEERVTELGWSSLLLTPLLHMVQGPLVSLGSFLLRPFQALQAAQGNPQLAWEVLLSSLFALAGFTFLLHRLIAKEQSDTPAPEHPHHPFAQLSLAGALMLLCAYPLTFTVRAFAISGRDTRVHTAAVVGAALLVGALLTKWLQISSRLRRRTLTVLPVSLLLALLVGYGFVVQFDYAQAWRLQQQFWSELIPLIQDAAPGDKILVEPAGLQDVQQIGANTWNLPVVITQLYRFTPDWGSPPRVLRLQAGWQERLLLSPGVFWLNAATVDASPSFYQQVDSTQVIFIETNSGELIRREAPMVLTDQEQPMKPRGETGAATLAEVKKGILYPFLIHNKEVPHD